MCALWLLLCFSLRYMCWASSTPSGEWEWVSIIQNELIPIDHPFSYEFLINEDHVSNWIFDTLHVLITIKHNMDKDKTFRCCKCSLCDFLEIRYCLIVSATSSDFYKFQNTDWSISLSIQKAFPAFMEPCCDLSVELCSFLCTLYCYIMEALGSVEVRWILIFKYPYPWLCQVTVCRGLLRPSQPCVWAVTCWLRPSGGGLSLCCCRCWVL